MKIFLLSLASLCCASAANACSCATTTIQENFKKADYVVKGQVVSLADTVQMDLYSNPVRPPFRYGYIPHLRVEKVLKGRIKRGKTIRVASYSSMCDFYFGLGLSYVVFLFKDSKAGFTTSVCVLNFLQTDKESLAVIEGLSRK
ncbi:hypothetical protein [Hymenobacter norwichensis]|uniref:hypothetical protein n=1 Tax=Hymenobacter norwichensis TaxID=223903 RepID=UPI0003B63D42|nr:hypothetical protein [Hymenobacter norwichensis]